MIRLTVTTPERADRAYLAYLRVSVCHTGHERSLHFSFSLHYQQIVYSTF